MNQLLEHKLNDIHKDLKSLTDIAIKTNGRIKSLELWRARLGGGMAVIILLLIPLVIQYFSKVVWAYFK